MRTRADAARRAQHQTPVPSSVCYVPSSSVGHVLPAFVNSEGTDAMTANYLGSLEQQQKAAAWSNATPTAHWSVKIDCDGRIIRWEEYGMLSEAGWQIDHIVPRASGGTDAFFNLRARHWLGNSTAGDHLSALRNVGRKAG